MKSRKSFTDAGHTPFIWYCDYLLGDKVLISSITSALGTAALKTLLFRPPPVKAPAESRTWPFTITGFPCEYRLGRGQQGN